MGFSFPKINTIQAPHSPAEYFARSTSTPARAIDRDNFRSCFLCDLLLQRGTATSHAVPPALIVCTAFMFLSASLEELTLLEITFFVLFCFFGFFCCHTFMNRSAITEQNCTKFHVQIHIRLLTSLAKIQASYYYTLDLTRDNLDPSILYCYDFQHYLHIQTQIYPGCAL